MAYFNWNDIISASNGKFAPFGAELRRGGLGVRTHILYIFLNLSDLRSVEVIAS